MLFNTERERDRREISVKMIIKWYDVIKKKQKKMSGKGEGKMVMRRRGRGKMGWEKSENECMIKTIH